MIGHPKNKERPPGLGHLRRALFPKISRRKGEQSQSFTDFNKVQRTLEVTDCTTRLANPLAPYGCVNRGLLSVGGLLKH